MVFNSLFRILAFLLACLGLLQVAVSVQPDNMFARHIRKVAAGISPSSVEKMAKDSEYDLSTSPYGAAGLCNYNAVRTLFPMLPSVYDHKYSSSNFKEMVEDVNEIINSGILTSASYIADVNQFHYFMTHEFDQFDFSGHHLFPSRTVFSSASIKIERLLGMENVIEIPDAHSMSSDFNAMVNVLRVLMFEYKSKAKFDFKVDFFIHQESRFIHEFIEHILIAMKDGDSFLTSFFACPCGLVRGSSLSAGGLFGGHNGSGHSNAFVGFAIVRRLSATFSIKAYAFGAGFKSFDVFTYESPAEEGLLALKEVFMRGSEIEKFFVNRTPAPPLFKAYTNMSLNVFYTPLELFLLFLYHESKPTVPSSYKRQLFLDIFQLLLGKINSPGSSINPSLEHHHKIIGLIRKFYVFCFPVKEGNPIDFQQQSVGFDYQPAVMAKFQTIVQDFLRAYSPAIQDDHSHPISDIIYIESIYRFILMGSLNSVLRSKPDLKGEKEAEFESSKRTIVDELRKKLPIHAHASPTNLYGDKVEFHPGLHERALDLRRAVFQCAREEAQAAQAGDWKNNLTNSFLSLSHPLSTYSIDRVSSASLVNKSISFLVPFIEEPKINPVGEPYVPDHLYRFVNLPKMLKTKSEDPSWILHCFPEYAEAHSFEIARTAFDPFFEKNSTHLFEWMRMFKFFRSLNGAISDKTAELLNYVRFLSGQFFMFAHKHVSQHTAFFRDKFVVQLDEYLSPTCFSDFSLLQASQNFEQDLSGLKTSSELDFFDLRGIDYPPPPPAPSFDSKEFFEGIFFPSKLEKLTDALQLKSAHDMVHGLHPNTLCLDMLFKVGLGIRQQQPSTPIKQDAFLKEISPYLKFTLELRDLKNIDRLLSACYLGLTNKLSNPKYSVRIYSYLLEFYTYVICESAGSKTREIIKFVDMAAKTGYYDGPRGFNDISIIKDYLANLSIMTSESNLASHECYPLVKKWLNYFYTAYSSNSSANAKNSYPLLDTDHFSSFRQNLAMTIALSEFHLEVSQRKINTRAAGGDADTDPQFSKDMLNDEISVYVGLSQINSYKSDGLGKLFSFFADKTILFCEEGIRAYFGNIFLACLVKLSLEKRSLYSGAMCTFFENSLIFIEKCFKQLLQREAPQQGSAASSGAAAGAANPPESASSLETADDLCYAYSFLVHQYLIGYQTHYKEGLPYIVQNIRKFETAYLPIIMKSRGFSDFLALRCCVYIIAGDSFHTRKSIGEFYASAEEEKIFSIFLRADFKVLLLKHLSSVSSIYSYDTVQSYGVYTAKHQYTSRIVSSSKPSILECIELLNSFGASHSFKDWFLAHYSSNPSDITEVTRAEVACPGSKCFHVTLAGGSTSRYLYCFDTNNMQVFDSLLNIVYKAPSFSRKFMVQKRNHQLQHFTHTLLLDAEPDKKLLYYSTDFIVSDLDKITRNHYLRENELFEGLPDSHPDNVQRIASTRIYKSGTAELASIVYEVTDLGEVHEIFPRIIYQGRLLHRKGYAVVYNVDSPQYMQINIGEYIFLTYCHETRPLPSPDGDKKKKAGAEKKEYETIFNPNPLKYELEPITVFMVTLESTPGYTGLIYCASDRKYEVYLAARYFSQGMFKFAWLKLKDIHNMFKFDSDELDILRVLLEQVAPSTSGGNLDKRSVDKRVFKFYIEYMLFMNFVSFGDVASKLVSSPPVVDELLELWALIPLYMKPTIYNAVKVMKSLGESVNTSGFTYRQEHQDSSIANPASFAPYHEEVIKRCPVNNPPNEHKELCTLYEVDLVDFYKHRDIKSNILNDAFGKNLCYLLEDARVANEKLKKDEAKRKLAATLPPKPPLYEAHTYDDALLLKLNRLQDTTGTMHIQYQVLFGDVFFATFKPAFINALKLLGQHGKVPDDHPVKEFESLFTINDYKATFESMTGSYVKHIKQEAEGIKGTNPIKAASAVMHQVLTFIALTNMTLYPRYDQVEDIAKFLDPQCLPDALSYRHLLLSKLMGGGKTSVIGPILGGLVKTDGRGLSVMVYIDALFKTNSRDIQLNMPKAGVYVFGFDFERDQFFDHQRWEHFYRLLADAKNRGNVICTKITTLQNLFNKYHEFIYQMLNPDPAKGTAVKEATIQEWKANASILLKILMFFREYGLLTIDEVDRALDPGIELNYPLKNENKTADPLKINIVSHCVEYLRNKDMLKDDAYSKYAEMMVKDIQKLASKTGSIEFVALLRSIFTDVIKEPETVKEFLLGDGTKFAVLTGDEFLEKLMHFCFYACDIPGAPGYDDKNTLNASKSAVVDNYFEEFEKFCQTQGFVADPKRDPKLSHQKLFELFNFLRKFLSDWLYEAIKKRIDEEYGPCPYIANIAQTKKTWEAIPYQAANTPAISSRFSAPYWLITLTFVMFQKNSVHESRYKMFIDYIRNELDGMLAQKFSQKTELFEKFLKVLQFCHVPYRLPFPVDPKNHDELVINVNHVLHKLDVNEAVGIHPIRDDLFNNCPEYRWIVIDFANKKMSAKEFNTRQINSLAFDFYGYFKSMNGYSGTLGSHYMYPRNSKVEEVEGELGAVTNRVARMQPGNFKIFRLAATAPVDIAGPPPKHIDRSSFDAKKFGSTAIARAFDILQTLSEHQYSDHLPHPVKPYHAIFDACAHFRGIGNLAVAEMLCECQKKMGIANWSIVAFREEDGTLLEISTKGRNSYSSTDKFSHDNIKDFVESGTGRKCPRCVYHPQTKCTGIDIKYDDGAVGLLLVDKDTLADRFKQAVFRLRGINTIQTTDPSLVFKHNIHFGINQDLVDSFASRHPNSTLADVKKKLLLILMENEVRSVSKKAEGVIFQKLKTEARCLFLDLLSELCHKGNSDVLAPFEKAVIRTMWQRIFFKSLSVSFPISIKYTLSTIKQTANAEADSLKKLFGSFKTDSHTLLGISPELNKCCDDHQNWLDTITGQTEAAEIIGNTLTLAGAAAFDGLGSSSDQELVLEEEEQKAEEEQKTEEKLQEQQKNEELFIRYDQEYTALRENVADYSSLDSFLNSLAYQCVSLESMLMQFIPEKYRYMDIPQFASNTYLSYHFWRFANEIGEPQPGMPEKVNSSLLVCWKNGMLQFWMMSSLETRTACKRLTTFRGFAVVSPLGDLIYSPHGSLENFFGYLAEKEAGNSADNAFLSSLDEQFSIAIFQVIIYNGFMFSLEKFCNSCCIASNDLRYKAFFLWLNPPRGVNLAKEPDNPFTQIYFAFQNRNLEPLRRYALYYSVNELFRGSVDSQIENIGKAYDALRTSININSVNLMMDLANDYTTFNMFSSLQRHYDVKYQGVFWLHDILVEASLHVLKDVREVFNYPKAEVLIDVLLKNVGHCKWDAPKQRELVTWLITRARQLSDIIDKWFVIERAVAISEIIGFDFANIESDVIPFIKNNIGRIFDTSIGCKYLANLLLYSDHFHPADLITIVSVNDTLVRALISSLVSKTNVMRVAVFEAIFTLPPVKQKLFANAESVQFLVSNLMDSRYFWQLLAFSYTHLERLTLLAFSYRNLRKTVEIDAVQYNSLKDQYATAMKNATVFLVDESRLIFLITDVSHSLFLDVLLVPEKEPVIAVALVQFTCQSILYYDNAPFIAKGAVDSLHIHAYFLPRIQRAYSLLAAADEVKYRHMHLSIEQIVCNLIWHFVHYDAVDEWDLHWKFVVRYQAYPELFHLLHRVLEVPEIHSNKQRVSFLALKYFNYLLFVSERSYTTSVAYCASITKILIQWYSVSKTTDAVYNSIVAGYYNKKRVTLGLELLIYLQSRLFQGIRSSRAFRALHESVPQLQSYDEFYQKSNSQVISLFGKDVVLYLWAIVTIFVCNVLIGISINVASYLLSTKVGKQAVEKAVEFGEPEPAADDHIVVYYDDDFVQN